MRDNLGEVAETILSILQEHGQGTEHGQVMALAEETGEFVGAMRRWRGMARRTGTEGEAQDELADVVITAYVTAELLGWDLPALIDRKLATVFSRGWKEGGQ